MLQDNKEEAEIISQLHHLGIMYINLPVINYDVVKEVVEITSEAYEEHWAKVLSSSRSISGIDKVLYL